jgi:hypothetical protein
VINRGHTMFLDLKCEGIAYTVRGERVGHFFIARGGTVQAKWSDFGDAFVGVWLEEGNEWLFRFRLA